MITEKNFTYPSLDGENTISAKIWVKADETPKAVLQIVHGMVEHKGRYEGFAHHMAEQGYLVCMNDMLGHGESVKNDADLGYINEKGSSDYLIADIHRLREIVQKEYPDLKFIMMGHSMGSYLLRKYLTYRGEGLMGAILMGTGFNPPLVGKFGLLVCKTMAKFKGWRYRSNMVRKMTYSASYKGYDTEGRDYENSWLSRNEFSVRAYYEDPKCGFLFTLAGYKALFEAVVNSCSKKNANLIRKDLPLLLVSGDADPVGSNGRGVKLVQTLYKMSGIKDITLKLYPEARHELIAELNKEEVYADICQWMDRVKTQQARWRRIGQ